MNEEERGIKEWLVLIVFSLMSPEVTPGPPCLSEQRYRHWMIFQQFQSLYLIIMSQTILNIYIYICLNNSETQQISQAAVRCCTCSHCGPDIRTCASAQRSITCTGSHISSLSNTYTEMHLAEVIPMVQVGSESTEGCLKWTVASLWQEAISPRFCRRTRLWLSVWSCWSFRRSRRRRN